MSGHKRATISIGNDVYSHLEEVQRAAASMSSSHSATVVIHHTDYIAPALDEVSYRQQALEDSLNRVHSHMAAVEQRAGQQILRSQQEFASRFTASTQVYWQQAMEWLDDQSAHLERVALETARNREQVLALEDRLLQERANQRQVQADRQAMTVNWLNTAATLFDFICENYDVDRFSPGRINRLNTQLQQARQNFDAGMLEACLLGSQYAYNALSDLRITLERRTAEYEMLIHTMTDALTAMETMLAEVREVEAVDLNGEVLNTTIDVAYWSFGGYQTLLDRVSQIRTRFEDDRQQMKSEDMRQVLEHELPNIHQELERIINDARLAALNSQLRINIADLIVSALSTQGFDIEEGGYAGEDMRRDYSARLVSIDGSEVVVQVKPTPGQDVENELHLISLDANQRSEHELRQRSVEIQKTLDQHGLNVSEFRTPSRSGSGQVQRLPARNVQQQIRSSVRQTR